MPYSDLVPRDLKDEELVKVTQVATWLSVNRKTVLRWSAQGRLPGCIKLGPHTHMYRVGDLRAALNDLHVADLAEVQEGA